MKGEHSILFLEWVYNALHGRIVHVQVACHLGYSHAMNLHEVKYVQALVRRGRVSFSSDGFFAVMDASPDMWHMLSQVSLVKFEAQLRETTALRDGRA